ncbi:hypothetical protein RhiirA4_536885 [Rhizophagus irregularis]|uniref:Uncharacterized protein n=1 Tax=Rhizophagus irregularis TaxID=588596 RepID=A0A2I1FUC6_9GLOM|nr:hypothetical protein RhiirA4_536885 [Rhizophagus irregularis]
MWQVATEQIKHYARSTTTSITKRFLDCKERTVKRAKIHEDSNGDENNPFYVSGEKSSTDSPNDIADNTLLVSGEKSSNDDSEDDEIVTSPSPQPQNGNKDSLSHTPNKREMSDERIVQYLIAMKQTLKYDQVTVQKPSVWTESLNTYSLKKYLENLKDKEKNMSIEKTIKICLQSEDNYIDIIDIKNLTPPENLISPLEDTNNIEEYTKNMFDKLLNKKDLNFQTKSKGESKLRS